MNYPSALAQLVLGYDWKQNIQVVVAINVPMGPDGREFRAVEWVQDDLFISTDASLFTQLAWYV